MVDISCFGKEDINITNTTPNNFTILPPTRIHVVVPRNSGVMLTDKVRLFNAFNTNDKCLIRFSRESHSHNHKYRRLILLEEVVSFICLYSPPAEC